MSRLSLLALPLFLVSCALVSPYTITFTTLEDAVVDPAVDTLDLVVSAPAYVYISEVECDGADDIEFLPVLKEEMQPSAAHNLSLTMLNGAPGAECEITVTAFDQTTTSTARGEIKVVIAGEVTEETPAEEPVVEEPTEEEPTPVVEAEVEAEVTSPEETPAE
jgi:hypothetical protein